MLLDKLHLSKRSTSSLNDPGDDNGYQYIEGTSLSIKTDGILLMEDSLSQSYTFGARDAENMDRRVNLIIFQSKETSDYSSFLIDYDLTDTDV